MTLPKIAPYTYRARVLRVIDGDGFEAEIDLGFHLALTTSVRVLGCNAAEVGTAGGDAARDFLTGLLQPGTQVELASQKPDKYGGRILAVVLFSGFDIAETLIERGMAARWDGRGTRPVPPWPPPGIPYPRKAG